MFVKTSSLFPFGTLGVTLLTVAALSMPLLSLPTHAAEIRLLSAAAMQSVFKEITADFEKTSGHKLIIHYGTIGAINQWILGGEEADLVIGSSLSMPVLVKKGKIDSTSIASICKTAIGVVVPSGDPKRPIASVEDFKKTLLTAKAIVYADPARGGAAGIHVASVIEKLGIAEQLKPKTKLAAGGDITEVTLALGSGALGMTQISEMAAKPGAQVLGPLPNELQNYTVFVGGIPSGVNEQRAAMDLIKYLKSPAAIAVIKAKGMQVD